MAMKAASNLVPLPLAALLLVAGPVPAKDLDPGFFLDLVALESARIEKQVCEEKHPEFSAKNAAAFAASPQSRKTGEELIAAATQGDERKRLLDHLPRVRADIRANYSQMSPQHLKAVCASYATAIDQVAQRGGAPQAGKP